MSWLQGSSQQHEEEEEGHDGRTLGYSVEGYVGQRNELHHGYEEEASGWFRRYFSFVEAHGRTIFVVWCVTLLVSLFIGPEFLTMGDDQVDPPHGSDAWKAQKVFDQRFKLKAIELPEIVLAFCEPKSDCTDIRTDEMRVFFKALQGRVLEYNQTHDIGIIEIMDYFVYENTLLDAVKEGFISPDHTTTIANIGVMSTKTTKTRKEFLNFLEDQIEELNPNKKKYNIGPTGFDVMMKDSNENTASQIAKIDMVTLPFAFFLLAFMIRSWRLLLLGIFNMVTSLMLTFTLLTLMVKITGEHPESASAQLTEVMCMALSLDYSLFMNRRFRDEIKVGASPRKAAFVSLHHAGHVVVMSGSTIVVVFIGFTIIPARSVQLDGVSCAIAISIAMLVSLTNTPALLMLFPGFFSDFDIRCCRKGASRRDCFDITPPVMTAPALTNGNGNGHSNGNGNGYTGDAYTLHEDHNTDDFHQINDDNNESSSLAKREIHNMYKSPRFRFTRMIVRWPYNIIAIVGLYIIVIPLAYNATRMNINQDILAGIPRKAGSAIRFKEMVETFSPGTFAPFSVMIALPHAEDPTAISSFSAAEPILSENFFDMAGFLAERIIERAHEHDERFTASNLQSPVLANGIKTTANEAKILLALAKSDRCVNPAENLYKLCSGAKQYEFLWNQNVNPEQDAMILTLIVPFFPFAQESDAFINVVRSVIDEITEKYISGDNAEFPGTVIYFCGFEVGFNALSNHVYGQFPVLLVVTLAGVFIVLGVLLQSAFVIVRLSLTLILPLAGVYGLAVLVYQDGILDWLSSSTSKTGGFFWYIPILITSMLVGLALDYDVFLISRVMEHRSSGYDIQAAIVKGVCETGGTIAAAGIIMTLVFGGMLLGDGGSVNMCGWMLATGVLMDTFVVNTILVPALLSFGDKVAWWPTKMPQDNLKGLDDPEFPQD